MRNFRQRSPGRGCYAFGGRAASRLPSRTPRAERSSAGSARPAPGAGAPRSSIARPPADRRAHRPLADRRPDGHAGRAVGGDGVLQGRDRQRRPDLLRRRDRPDRRLRPLVLRLGLPHRGAPGRLALAAQEARDPPEAAALAAARAGFRSSPSSTCSSGRRPTGSGAASRSPCAGPSSPPAHFWATFPGWIVGALTFLVCGFVAVYFLGAKGFCTYACPYGAVFSCADKVSHRCGSG